MKRNYLIGLSAFFFASLFLLLVDSNNLGFSSDAITYLEGAKNIKAGKGYIFDDGQLINHWPPLYSILIALTSILTKVKLLYSAKYLHALLIIGIIILLDKIFKNLKLNKYLSLFSIFLFFISAASKVFLWQLSEGLFTFFILYSYYLFLLWAKYDGKKTLIGAGVISALFFLTRFAGIGFIVAYCAFIFFFKSSDLRKKIIALSLYLIPFIILVIPWFLYAKTMGANLQDRSFEIHLITVKHLENFISVIKNWFFGNYITVKLAPFFALVIFYGLFKERKKNSVNVSGYITKNGYTILLAGLLIILYLLFIFISASFFDRGIPFDNRILYPVFPFLIILIAILLQFLYSKKVKLIFYSLGLFLLISFTVSGIPVYKAYYNHGLGFTHQKWRNSEIIRYISKDDNLIYYSNATEILKLNTSKKGKKITNKSKSEELNKIKSEVMKGDAQVLILKPFLWPDYLVSEDQIQQKFQGFKYVYFQNGYLIKDE